MAPLLLHFVENALRASSELLRKTGVLEEE
jgi:hypothetical protein